MNFRGMFMIMDNMLRHQVLLLIHNKYDRIMITHNFNENLIYYESFFTYLLLGVTGIKQLHVRIELFLDRSNKYIQ